MNSIIDTTLIAFVPVGLSFLAYVLTTEMKKGKTDRIENILRNCGTAQIQVGRGENG